MRCFFKGKLIDFKHYIENHYRERPAHPVKSQSDYSLLPHTRWALRWIGDDAKRVVDLGCHEGHIGAVIRDAGHDVIGVDFPSLTERATTAHGLKTIAHDLNESLPFKDGEFDVILAISILDYLPNDLLFLKECRRVLHDRGVLIAGIPNAVSLYNRMASFVGCTGRNFGDPTGYHTINHYTIKGISQLLRLAGFKVRDVQKAPKTTSRLPLRTVLERILPSSFATDILVKAHPG